MYKGPVKDRNVICLKNTPTYATLNTQKIISFVKDVYGNCYKHLKSVFQGQAWSYNQYAKFIVIVILI